MKPPTTENYIEALTPSEGTKAAYMGEFTMKIPMVNEDGDEFMQSVNVPWITIKEIMAAIRTRAGHR